MAQSRKDITFGDLSRGFQLGINSNPIHHPLERPETPPSPSSTVPFPRDHDYIDRKELLELVRAKCSIPASRTTLVGLGGVGKSQLAIEYSYQVRDQSPGTWVFWVHASNAARIEQSYRDIADRAKILGRKDPQANVFKLVYDWLCNRKNGKWLLILDNIDDARYLYEASALSHDGVGGDPSRTLVQPLLAYLPQSQNGSILITTRNRSRFAAWSGIIEVQPMDEAHAIALFEKKLGKQSDNKNVAELVRALDCMPLAIVQAAAYISQRAPRSSVQQYLEEFRRSDRKKTSLLKHEAGHLRRDWEAENSIITTWQESFEHVRQVRPSAAYLLSLMSLFDQQGITDILNQGAEDEKGHKGAESSNIHYDGDSDKELTRELIQREGFEDDIQTLRNYSFLSLTDKAVFKMHKLVQLATQEWLASTSQLGSGQAALSWAASYGQKTIVELLLEKGADVAFKDNKGWTALSWAAANGHDMVVGLLVEKGSNLESKDSHGRTALSRAAGNGHDVVVGLLIEKGANLESKDSHGRTPLSYAASDGNENVVKLLLLTGSIGLDSRDANGRTPLAYAIEKGDETVIKLLEDWSVGDAHSTVGSSVAGHGHNESFWSSQKREYAESIQSTAPTEYTDLPRLTYSEIVSTQEVIAQMLAEDIDLLPLFRTAITDNKIGVDRLERNFTRLLGMYSKELVNRAEVDLYRDAAAFVGTHADYISKTIHRRLDVPSNFAVPQNYSTWQVDAEVEGWKKSITEYLGKKQRNAREDGDIPNELELESNVLDEASDGQREENIMNHLEQVKQFLREGDPLKDLRSRLRDFVSAKGTEFEESVSDNLTIHAGSNAAYLDGLANFLVDTFDKSLVLANLVFAAIVLYLKFVTGVRIWDSVIIATAVAGTSTSETMSMILHKVIMVVSSSIRVLQTRNSFVSEIQPGCSRVLWKCTCTRMFCKNFSSNEATKAFMLYEAFTRAGYPVLLQASSYPLPGHSKNFKEMYNTRISTLVSSSFASGSDAGLWRQSNSRPGSNMQRGQATEKGLRYESDDSISIDDSDEPNTSDQNERVPKTRRRWLLFCFQHYGIDSKALHVRLQGPVGDEKLFRSLRKMYYGHKIKPWMRYLGLTRFVAYLTDYKVKRISFVQFRLWPGKQRILGMPKKEVGLKPPYEWKSSSEWDPDPNKDIPEFPEEFFLCHWAHPEDKHSRLLTAIKLTSKDIFHKFAKLGATRFIGHNVMGALRGLKARRSDQRQVFSDAHIEEGEITNLPEYDRGNVTIAESQGLGNQWSFFLPSHPTKVHKKLKPNAPNAPRGWGLFVEEEKKRFWAPFILSLCMFFVNIGVFSHVMYTSEWPLGSMFFSGSSLAWAIVIFFVK